MIGSEAIMESAGRREVPEWLREHLMQIQGGIYLPAAARIAWFRSERPDWGITVDIVEGGHEAGYVTVRASILNAEGRVIACDYKTETRQDFPAGWVEKASTGAISRALALAGFGTLECLEFKEDGRRPSNAPVRASRKPELEARRAAWRELRELATSHGFACGTQEELLALLQSVLDDVEPEMLERVCRTPIKQFGTEEIGALMRAMERRWSAPSSASDVVGSTIS